MFHRLPTGVDFGRLGGLVEECRQLGVLLETFYQQVEGGPASPYRREELAAVAHSVRGTVGYLPRRIRQGVRPELVILRASLTSVVRHLTPGKVGRGDAIRSAYQAFQQSGLRDIVNGAAADLDLAKTLAGLKPAQSRIVLGVMVLRRLVERMGYLGGATAIVAGFLLMRSFTSPRQSVAVVT